MLDRHVCDADAFTGVRVAAGDFHGAALYAERGCEELHDLPVGCSFADRCPYVMDKCREEFPPEFPVAEGHYSACWRLE